MRKSIKLLLVSLILILPVISFSAEKKPSMAPLCKSCHQADSNMVRGTLDYFVEKIKTFQIDLSGPTGPVKEVFKYDNCTKVKNLEEITDMTEYKGKAFRVYYYENQKGEKIASLITRFDILANVIGDEKLDKEGLKKIIQHDKNIQIIDARPPIRYKEGYIPGSIVIPAADLEKMADKLPKDKNTTLIFYCVGGCSSPTAAVKAKAMGYKNVKVYAGGFPDWISSEISFIDTAMVADSLKKDELSYAVIDTNPKDFAEKGHLPNAVNTTSKDFDSFKTKLPKKKMIPLVVYGKDANEVASKLIALGYKGTRVLTASIEEWTKAGYPVIKGKTKDKIEFVAKPKPGTISKDEFEKLLVKLPTDTILIDVRTPSEYKAGSFPGAVNIPVEDLAGNLTNIAKDKKVVVSCATGVRAEMGFNLLKDAGYNVRYLDAVNKFEKESGAYEVIPN